MKKKIPGNWKFSPPLTFLKVRPLGFRPTSLKIESQRTENFYKKYPQIDLKAVLLFNDFIVYFALIENQVITPAIFTLF